MEDILQTLEVILKVLVNKKEQAIMECDFELAAKHRDEADLLKKAIQKLKTPLTRKETLPNRYIFAIEMEQYHQYKSIRLNILGEYLHRTDDFYIIHPRNSLDFQDCYGLGADDEVIPISNNSYNGHCPNCNDKIISSN